MILRRFPRCLFRSRFSGVNEVGNPGFDGLVRRQLGLGVELEFAFRPSERRDDGVVACFPVALGVKEVPEQEIERRRLSVAITESKGTCRPLALGRFQKRTKRDFGQ